jgi:hypothetical protein
VAVDLTGNSIEQVVDSYAQFLEKTFGNPSVHLKAYVDRLNANPESARAEAVIFAWLHATGMNPMPNEDVSEGGIDFICRLPGGQEFAVEVSSLGIEAVADSSRWEQDFTHLSSGTFRLVTPMLRTRVGLKMEQLSSVSMPRVLAVTCEHMGADVLLGEVAALSLFVSNPKLRTSLTVTREIVDNITDLTQSVFFRPERNNPLEVVSARRAASAVLFVPILQKELRPIGILHPDAEYPVNLDYWYRVPFLRLTEWPIVSGKIKVEWTLLPGAPYPVHRRIR